MKADVEFIVKNKRIPSHYNGLKYYPDVSEKETLPGQHKQ